MPNLFDKEQYVIHYENIQLYLRLGLKLKKIHCVLEFNQSQWLKTIYWIQHTKKAEKKDNEGKVLYKFMNNAISRKAMENLTDRINANLVNNEKDYLRAIIWEFSR